MTTWPTSTEGPTSGGVSIGEKVTFLSSPTAFPEPVQHVEVKETHMSWVFFAGDRVYKLKKPVTYPFLDFSTVAAREADCREEDRLNRRLAPDVYLGVVPLTESAGGKLALGGKGEVVDWLVMMRRLPEEQLLDVAIVRGRVTQVQIGTVADLLAGFYRNLEPAGVSEEDYVDQFDREQTKNQSVLTNGQFDLPEALLKTVFSRIEHVLREAPELLRARVRQRRIVDGHGDLRPEHVCLSEPPVIIDCLEFSRALRLVDPFDELSFLSMECEQLGAPWIGEMLVNRCAKLLGDRPPDRLLAFYTAYRACLRARLAVAHLLEPNPRKPGKWTPLAADYLAIAERACLTLNPRAVR